MSNDKSGGVYLLYSRFPDGRFIYKVGMSENLKCRINSYPPNWFTILCYPCKTPRDMENKLLKFLTDNKATIGIDNCIKGKEYFESDEDRRENILNRLCDLDGKMKDFCRVEAIRESTMCSPPKRTVIFCTFSNIYSKEDAMKLIEQWKPSTVIYSMVGDKHNILAIKEGVKDSQILKMKYNGMEITTNIDEEEYKKKVDFYIETIYNNNIFDYHKIIEYVYSDKICIYIKNTINDKSECEKLISEKILHSHLHVMGEKQGMVEGKYVWYIETAEKVKYCSPWNNITIVPVKCCPIFDSINVSTITEFCELKDKSLPLLRALLSKRKLEFMLTWEDIALMTKEDILEILS